MKIIFRLMRYVFRYRWTLIISIIFGTIGSFLSVFNIVAFKPILEVIFTPPRKAQTALTNKQPTVSTAKEGKEKTFKIPLFHEIEERFKPYRKAIDARIEQITSWAIAHKMKTIYIIGIIVAITGLIKGLVTYLSDYLMAFTGMSIVKDIRQEIHEHILRMDLPFFEDRSTGQLLARTSNDVSTMNTAITSVMDVGIQSPISIIMILILLYYLSPQLTIYSIFVVPAIGILIGVFGRKIRKISKKAQETIGDVMGVMQETYDGIRVVKAFGMEDFESQRFLKTNIKAYKTYLHRQAVRKIFSPLMEFLGILAAISALFAGAHLILSEGTLTGADFFVFIIALSRLYRPIKDLSHIHLDVQTGLAGAERVFEILDTSRVLEEKPDATHLTSIREGISFHNVSFRYNNNAQYALRNITVDIPRGNVTAIVGRSGAGKTTFVNILCRFYDPTEGAILIDNRDLRDYSLKSLREKIAIVTQQVILFNETVRNNIAYGRKDIPLEAVIEAGKKAYAHEFIEKLPDGYDTQIGQHGDKLSGGERQRLAIARAILKNPELLVFDEATSALDSEAETKIQQAMKNLIQGRTTIIIAHRLSTVKIAHEIIVLDEGQVVERGSHDDLLRLDGHYARLSRLQGIFVDSQPSP